MSNQCDGCNNKMPIVNGIHRDWNDNAFMACTKERYKEASKANDRLEAINKILDEGFDGEEYDLQSVNVAHKIASGGDIPKKIK